MEEGILGVELMDRLVPGELDDGAKGLIVVHSRTLGEASKDQRAL
jgi:hypothetical protein